MSNVLIGIIGVILFIGLALAGALFLGPRFQESVNNSKATAALQAVAQISSAANMYNVDTGTPLRANANIVAILTPQYMKAIPSNPVSGGLNPSPVNLTGTSTGDAGYIVMPIGDPSWNPKAKPICDAIARQTGVAGGVAPTIATWDPANLPGVSGCVKSDQDVGGSAAGDYVIYSRI